MFSIVVTGANRGIGLGLVKSFLEHDNPPSALIATARDPGSATELNELAKKHKNLHILKLDVNKLESFPEFVKQVELIVGDDGLNVLLNNAGILLYMPELETAVPEKFTRTLHTNTVAPVFLVQALLPLIKKAAAKNADKGHGITRAAILNMSSLLGSVSMSHGGVYGYESSKAALNQATRSMAKAYKDLGILVLPLHPGWVQTELGGSKAPLSVDDSVAGLTKVIYGLNQSHHDTFIQWNGLIVPW